MKQKFRYIGKRFTKLNNIYIEDEQGDYLYTTKGIRKLKDSDLFAIYKKEVKRLSEIVISKIDCTHTRDWANFHIDHKVSISFGYKNNIDAKDIACITNLRLITAKENLSKGVNCYFDDLNGWIAEKYNLLNEINS